MIDFISGTACLADGGYDATRIINELKDRGINPVIPPSRNRKTQRRYDKKLYKQRYLVEVFFHNIKRFRRIATRYDKTSSCYLAFVQIGCILQWIL
jgi:transposase